MKFSKWRRLGAVLSLGFAGSIEAVTVDAFFSQSTDFVSPGIPQGTAIRLGGSAMKLADAGTQTAYVMDSLAAASVYGIWRFDGVSNFPAAMINQTGAMGPARTSPTEIFYAQLNNQPFLNIEQGGNGQIVFSGLAGEASLGADFATQGLWLNNGGSNREIARVQVTGALGPGSVAGNTGLMFENASNFFRQLMFNHQGRVAMFARVGSGISYPPMLLQYTGSAWSVCARNGDSSSALGPNYLDRTFDNFSSSNLHAMGATGRIFGVYELNTGRGVWELCNGNPRPLAVTADTTPALNPGLGASSYFTTVNSEPMVFNNDAALVHGRARVSAVAAEDEGLFIVDGNNNRPIALLSRIDQYGPQLPNATFSSLAGPYSTNRQWVAFKAGLQLPSGISNGLFRYSADTGIQPLALQRTGAYSPTSTTFWNTLNDLYVTPNGDLIVYAEVCSRATDNLNCAAGTHRREIWKLPRIGAPVRLLGPGDIVRAFSVSGPPGGAYSGTIDSIDLSFGAISSSHENNSIDNWVSATGILQARVSVTGSSVQHHVRLSVFDPGELFKDGFENP